jgi:eukaryotic-like serine/threonine-protein kinase
VKHMVIQSSQRAPAVGTVVAAKYRVDRILAEGGMGVVVAATHLQLGRCVAVKFLRGNPISVDVQWDAFARFSLEAKTVARLRSEHVAHVLDAGVTDDGTPYMVMEYLEGVTLARSLERDGALDVATAVEYAIQACEGLAEAHAHGIVHRDIKPYNLFLVERWPGWHVIKIVDFGISKVAFAEVPNLVTGVIVGTPCYMSPEQLRSTATVDHRSDIWSLGATLHELLVGRAAFDASQTLPEIVTAILEHTAPSLHALRAEVPEELAAIVMRCLAKDREARFQSAGDVAMALLAFAPARARVPAERAAAMKPAFATSLQASDPFPEASAPAHATAVQPDAQTPNAPAATDGSLAPTAMGAPGNNGETPSQQTLTTLEASTRADKDMEAEQELVRRRPPKWLGVAALGAAAGVLFLVILIASPANRSAANLAAKPAQQYVAVPALTRPEASSMPPVSLAPLEATQPKPVEVVARAPATAAPIATESAAAGGNLPVARRDHPPATRTHATRQVAAQTPLFGSAPATANQTSVASTGAELVDSIGGKMPLRPIETKDPYGQQ